MTIGVEDNDSISTIPADRNGLPQRGGRCVSGSPAGWYVLALVGPANGGNHQCAGAHDPQPDDASTDSSGEAMKRLVILVPLLLAGCTSGMSNLSPTFMESLAHDPNTSCVAMGAIPPYFGGFFWARQAPNGGNSVDCGIAKIGAMLAPPTMLVAPGTQAPSVISLTPQVPVAAPAPVPVPAKP